MRWTARCAVPFRRGVAGKGGMPADFDMAAHGLTRLHVTCASRRGICVHAADVEPLASISGRRFARVRAVIRLGAGPDDRPLPTLVAGERLLTMKFEGSVCATLLHTFLVTFGLLVAGNKSLMLTVIPGGMA